MLEQYTLAFTIPIFQKYPEKQLVWIVLDTEHIMSIFPLNLPNVKKKVKEKIIAYGPISISTLTLQSSTKRSHPASNFPNNSIILILVNKQQLLQGIQTW